MRWRCACGSGSRALGWQALKRHSPRYVDSSFVIITFCIVTCTPELKVLFRRSGRAGNYNDVVSIVVRGGNEESWTWSQDTDASREVLSRISGDKSATESPYVLDSLVAS